MFLRPESSVSMGTNVDGELVFACDRSGPVIHRTPEELGIPRTVVSDQSSVVRSEAGLRLARASAARLIAGVERRRAMAQKRAVGTDRSAQSHRVGPRADSLEGVKARVVRWPRWTMAAASRCTWS